MILYHGTTKRSTFITKVPDMSSPSFKRSCRQAKLDKYRPLSETLKMEKSIGQS